jgi:Ca-activated chloride channel family protein
MTFKNQGVLLLLLLAPFILLSFHYSYLKRERFIKSFFSTSNFAKIGVFRSRGKLFLKSLFITLAYCMAVIALAGPRYGFKDINLSTIGNNVFIAIDTSKSMNAQDIKPDRITVAKRKIIDFVNNAKGERIALIPFAGQPYMLIPLTTDYSIFKSFIDIVDTDLIPVQSTDFYNLINRMAKVISKYKLTNVALLILSDGEDFGGNIDAAIKLCKNYKITIYAIGIGSGEPAPIPLKNGGFKKDKNGSLITTRLNEKFLENLALSTNGVYVKSTSTSEDIEFIYKKIAANNKINKAAIYKKRIYFNRFQWFLMLSFIFLCFYFVINEKKLKSVITLILMVMIFQISPLLANPYFNNKRGISSFNKHQYRESIEYFNKAFKEDKNLKFKFNLGDSLYKLKKYDNSSRAFTSIIDKSKSSILKEKAFYNRGVINYTQKKFKKALDDFKLAIKLNPEDKEARINYELTLKKLQQKQKNQKHRQKNNNQQKQKKKKKQKNQQNQQKNKQNESKKHKENPSELKKQKKNNAAQNKDKEKIDKKLLNLYNDNKVFLKQAIKKHFLMHKYKNPEKDW